MVSHYNEALKSVSAFFFLYLLIGATAGLLAGLFGIGGGVVLVPFLAWIYPDQGIPGNLIMLVAIATSLATIIFTSLASISAHHRLGAIRWEIVLRLAPAILVGSLAGSLLTQHLDSSALKTIFGIFLTMVSIQTGFQIKPRKQTLVLGKWLAALAGTVIGGCSSLLGIGGGTLTVPFLLKCRQPIRNAVAISSACGLPIAVSGTIGYIILGWNEPQMPAWSLGYIYGPAFAGIVTTSIVFAPMGARLAHRLPTSRLKRLFAVFLFIIGCKLLTHT
jgi:uncharacterized membrane protein YfcA